MRHEKYDVTYAMQLFYKEAGVRLGAPYFNATYLFSFFLTRSFRNNTSVCFHQLLGTNVVLAGLIVIRKQREKKMIQDNGERE